MGQFIIMFYVFTESVSEKYIKLEESRDDYCIAIKKKKPIKNRWWKNNSQTCVNYAVSGRK